MDDVLAGSSVGDTLSFIPTLGVLTGVTTGRGSLEEVGLMVGGYSYP
jgi:hypothetical protein